MRQSVDLLQLSLRFKLALTENFSLFLKHFHVCGTTYRFSSGTEVFSRGISNTRKITNFLGKDNTEQESIITLWVYSCFDKRFFFFFFPDA